MTRPPAASPSYRPTEDAAVTRRAALRDFLRSRRGRLSPGDVGLIEGGRRHTPGLRREEVAVLAGVSGSWYTWLEQGRDINVSFEVLDAISEALKLDHVDRAHLYSLAGLNPPRPSTRTRDVDVRRLRALVEGWSCGPAFALDRYWNVLTANAPARDMLEVPECDNNYLLSFFTNQGHIDRYANWNDHARRLVGQFRVQAALFSDDARFARLAHELCAASQEFDRLWARHETADTSVEMIEIRVEADGTRRFDRVTLGFEQQVEPRLMLFLPVSPTERTTKTPSPTSTRDEALTT